MSVKKVFALVLHGGVHLAALLPLAWLFWAIPAGELGGDPVEELIHFLGLGALRLLLLSLLISPLLKSLKIAALFKLRRPLGLWAYTWASLHFFAWLALDLVFEWGLIGEEIIQRSYILLGFCLWLILSALALTSLPRLMRAMQSKWQKLHWWIYPAAIMGCIHFWWSLKSGWLEPAVYLLITLVLIGLRQQKLLRIFAR
ncbi:sulfoxide reductase heme-binding subunit YedZ [Gammaproteobacteria bacterium 53_120_T64]|nr:sulfoxide reductase heme-binding subunit YedZ [Gammaproteobacteria bacterium 53_120_T64]